jgi:hypothetical protein
VNAPLFIQHKHSTYDRVCSAVFSVDKHVREVERHSQDDERQGVADGQGHGQVIPESDINLLSLVKMFSGKPTRSDLFSGQLFSRRVVLLPISKDNEVCALVKVRQSKFVRPTMIGSTPPPCSILTTVETLERRLADLTLKASVTEGARKLMLVGESRVGGVG